MCSWVFKYTNEQIKPFPMHRFVCSCCLFHKLVTNGIKKKTFTWWGCLFLLGCFLICFLPWTETAVGSVPGTVSVFLGIGSRWSSASGWASNRTASETNPRPVGCFSRPASLVEWVAEYPRGKHWACCCSCPGIPGWKTCKGMWGKTRGCCMSAEALGSVCVAAPWCAPGSSRPAADPKGLKPGFLHWLWGKTPLLRVQINK